MPAWRDRRCRRELDIVYSLQHPHSMIPAFDLGRQIAGQHPPVAGKPGEIFQYAEQIGLAPAFDSGGWSVGLFGCRGGDVGQQGRNLASEVKLCGKDGLDRFVLLAADYLLEVGQGSSKANVGADGFNLALGQQV